VNFCIAQVSKFFNFQFFSFKLLNSFDIIVHVCGKIVSLNNINFCPPKLHLLPPSPSNLIYITPIQAKNLLPYPSKEPSTIQAKNLLLVTYSSVFFSPILSFTTPFILIPHINILHEYQGISYSIKYLNSHEFPYYISLQSDIMLLPPTPPLSSLHHHETPSYLMVMLETVYKMYIR